MKRKHDFQEKKSKRIRIDEEENEYEIDDLLRNIINSVNVNKNPSEEVITIEKKPRDEKEPPEILKVDAFIEDNDDLILDKEFNTLDGLINQEEVDEDYDPLSENEVIIINEEEEDDIIVEDVNSFIKDLHPYKMKWKNTLEHVKYESTLPTDLFTFQQLETDYVTTYAKRFKFQYPGPQRGKVPVIRLFGIKENGQSVLCRVWGFQPYFYVEVSHDFDINEFKKALESVNKEVIIDKITKKYQEKKIHVFDDDEEQELNKELQKKIQNVRRYINVIKRIQLIEKTSIWGYQFGKKKKFFKIFTIAPSNVPQLRKILEDGISIENSYYNFQTYESNVIFSLRCMVDKNIYPTCWISVKNFEYSQSKNSLCNIEIDVSCDNLNCFKPEGVYQKIAPFKILSFDIECKGYVEKGLQYTKVRFPKAEQAECQVIQIANVISINNENIIKNCFTLNTCAEVDKSKGEVLCFQTEEELLMGWRDFVRTIDPDIITGYNIIGFDFPYLFDRAKFLKLQDFSYLSRVKDSRCYYRKQQRGSKQMGKRKSNDIKFYGRCIFDVISFIKGQPNYRLPSYTLNYVSKLFLGQSKEDVHYSMIPKLQDTSAETRKKLVTYCIKDALLPMQLITKLCAIINTAELSRVIGINMSLIWERGQQIRVVSQLLRACKEKEMVIPTFSTKRGRGFKGATVLEPQKGFHKRPIATLDFASLYPSIMINHNLCFTSWLKKEDLKKLKESEYTKTTKNHYFIKSHLHKGLLCEILKKLLDTRKKVKTMMKTEKDPLKKTVLNGRQMALKVSANSIYGFTGAQTNPLQCVPIGESVTGYGRTMIDDTKDWIEKTYTKKNGYKEDAKVIYGDTV